MSLFRFRHSTFLPYYYKVYSNMKAFVKMVDKAVHAPTFEERMAFALDAVNFAEFHPTGYYASPEIEGVFLEAAATLPEVKCNPIKNTVLHVMTQAYTSGGHTRVVQRWMDLSKTNEKHDVVLLNQEKEKVPGWLEVTALKHKGSVIRIDESDILKRAAKLRELAAKYEHIILHVHMDDPTAIIAFGVESFTTPVIFFNHADHMFWLGVSVSDVVADLRFDNISYTHRNVRESYILGIPCAPKGSTDKVDKAAIRKELGISENDFVIITTGTAFKYTRLGRNSLCMQFIDIVNNGENISCYAIGPDKNCDPWQKAIDVTNGKVHPLGIIKDKALYQKYLSSADLYVGSYPYPSYTATLEAVQCGMPYLQLLVTPHQDFDLRIVPTVNISRCTCHSTGDLVQRALEVIRDKQEYKEMQNTSVRWAEEYANSEQWQKRLYEMYEECPKVHTVYSFTIKRGKHVQIDDNDCMIGLLHDKENFEFKNRFMRRLAHCWMRMKGV